jgi:predicted glutamine amidotransferase
MCRWIAYSGEPIPLERVVTRPAHSLVDQSLHTQLNYHNGAVLPTNGDGFGIGWYGDLEEPCIFKDEHPAWSNPNLQNLCRHIRSRLFFAHIRATTTGAVQRTNCHPFCYKNWMFQHNGGANDFGKIRRDLHREISPEIYPWLQGTTDSETFFLLSLSFGLETDVKSAFEKAILCFRQAAKARGTDGQLNLSCALSDGETLYTIRYAENTPIKSQFYSTHPELLSDFTRHEAHALKDSVLFLSEPVGLGDKWVEAPENSLAVTRGGEVTIQPLEV